MPKYMFTIEKLPAEDLYRGRVRIDHTRRDGAKRFDIIKVTNGDKVAYVCAMGHQLVADKLLIDFDTRELLGLRIGDQVELEVKKSGWLGNLVWYLKASDPVVRVPAWLTIWSFLLAFIGIVLSILALK